MSAPAASLEALLETVQRLERKLDALTERERPKRRNREARLVSKRAAARALGIDRSTTLEDLIHDKQIRTVPVRGHLRIPATEIERLTRDGIPEPGRTLKKRPEPEPEGGDGIRDLEVD